MVMMREKPELFAYLMERRGRQRMEMLKGLARVGVEYVWLEECLSSADLISPRDYERFAFATTGPTIAEAKRLGLTVILYYCGDVIPRLPWLVRLGMDALAVEESKKGFSVDIAEVIAAVGDTCCVFGNVDAVQVMCEGSRRRSGPRWTARSAWGSVLGASSSARAARSRSTPRPTRSAGSSSARGVTGAAHERPGQAAFPGCRPPHRNGRNPAVRDRPRHGAGPANPRQGSAHGSAGLRAAHSRLHRAQPAHGQRHGLLRPHLAAGPGAAAGRRGPPALHRRDVQVAG